MDANKNFAEFDNYCIFHAACLLRGELDVAVLTLFLSKNSETVQSIHYESLPIHCAAAYSSSDVIKFLLKAYPESLTMVLGQGNAAAGSTLLHLALQNS
jgi:hypothetical protein